MKYVKHENKAERVLWIYYRLIRGYAVNKYEMAAKFLVDERTVQRDIDDIRAFLDSVYIETGESHIIKYDYNKKSYILTKDEK